MKDNVSSRARLHRPLVAAVVLLKFDVSALRYIRRRVAGNAVCGATSGAYARRDSWAEHQSRERPRLRRFKEFSHRLPIFVCVCPAYAKTVALILLTNNESSTTAKFVFTVSADFFK